MQEREDRDNDKMEVMEKASRVKDARGIYDSMFDRKQRGVKTISLLVKPYEKIHFPLEILFKIVHADDKILMVKYNPGKNKENIYRFFTDNFESKGGDKIPKLYAEVENQYEINDLMVSMAPNRNTVSFFIKTSTGHWDYQLMVEFRRNGDIQINVKSDHLMQIEEIDKIIQDNINQQILTPIVDYLLISGYQYVMFEGIYRDNVKIVDIETYYALKINRVKNLREKMKSFNHILFEDIENSRKGSLRYFYKKVENYNELDRRDAFFMALWNAGGNNAKNVSAISQQYGISKLEALRQFNEWSEGHELLGEGRTQKQHRNVIKSEVSAASILITESKLYSDDKISINSYLIKIEHIDDLKYLDFMDKYLFAIVSNISGKMSDKDEEILREKSLPELVEETRDDTEQIDVTKALVKLKHRKIVSKVTPETKSADDGCGYVTGANATRRISI